MKILRSFLAVACGICILFTIACVALFGGAVWLAFSFLVPMQNPVPRFCGFGFYLLHAVVFQGILGIRFNYSGTPIRPADSGDAFIVISNHPPLQLLFAVPACFWGVVNTYAAVIKKEFLQFPLFWLGWPSVLAGMAVPIDRGDKSAAYEAISKYAERLPFGKRPFAVILFPDGSRPTPEKIVGRVGVWRRDNMVKS